MQDLGTWVRDPPPPPALPSSPCLQLPEVVADELLEVVEAPALGVGAPMLDFVIDPGQELGGKCGGVGGACRRSQGALPQ